MLKLKPVPSKFETVALWQSFWKEEAKSALQVPNLILPKSKKIQIYSDDVTDRDVISNIMTGIMLLLVESRISLNLDRKYNSPALNHSILKSADENGKINCELLAPNIDFDSGLIIVTSKLHSDTEKWGEADFYSGVGILSFPYVRLAQLRIENRLEYVQITAKHVATHLLGYRIHHENSIISGYRDELQCNMKDDAPVLTTCAKCVKAVSSFWQGIKEVKK